MEGSLQGCGVVRPSTAVVFGIKGDLGAYHNVSESDALYVALARRLQASLLTTADARPARFPRLGVPVTVVTA